MECIFNIHQKKGPLFSILWPKDCEQMSFGQLEQTFPRNQYHILENNLWRPFVLYSVHRSLRVSFDFIDPLTVNRLLARGKST